MQSAQRQLSGPYGWSMNPPMTSFDLMSCGGRSRSRSWIS
jgi:hypothetical protein